MKFKQWNKRLPNYIIACCFFKPNGTMDDGTNGHDKGSIPFLDDGISIRQNLNQTG